MLLEKWLLLRESAYATRLIFTSVVLKKKIVARKKLTQEGSPLLDNYSLFSTLLDKDVTDLMPPSFCNEEQW